MDRIEHWMLTNSQSSVYDAEEKSLLKIMSNIASKINEVIDDYNSIHDDVLQRVTIDDLEKNRHLSKTGDFTGTLNGYPIVSDSTGLSTTVSGHTTEISNLKKIAVNIDSYGAKPNDPTFDNTPIINSAINDISTKYGGGTVVISGLYYFRPTISLKDNVTLMGQNGYLKVMDNSPEYWGAIWCKQHSNMQVLNLNVDQNLIGNPNVDVNIVTKSNPLAIFYVNQSNNVKIEGCKTIGFGVWGITADSTNTNLIVRDNYLQWVQGPSTRTLSGTIKYDNTQMFIDAIGSIVENNTIVCNDFNGMTAIEMHNRNGVARNNTIRGFRTGVILMTTLNAQPDNEKSVLGCKGNKIYHCLYGVVFWSVDTADTDNIIVCDNQIYCDNLYFNMTYNPSMSSHGIMFNLRNVNNNVKKFKNISIYGNTITFADDATTYTDPNASFNFTGINVTAYHNMENINVKNNLIINSPSIGIRVGCTNVGATWYTLDGADITSNTIIDAGKNTNLANTGGNPVGYQSGVALVGSYKNVNIGVNTVIDRKSSGAYIVKPLYEINQNSGTRNLTLQNIIGNLTQDASFLNTWNNATFLNGTTKNGTTTVQFAKNERNEVRLRGAINVGTNGQACFTLPTGYIPSSALVFNGGTLNINTLGQVVSYKGTGSVEYLDGITFVV